MVCLSINPTSNCFAYLQIPHVNRQEYTLLDINEDGFVSVLVITYPLGRLMHTLHMQVTL